MIYPEAIVSEDAKTRINKLKSSKILSAPFSGANINIAERYCARIIIGMLYPLITENKLRIFSINSLLFLLNIEKG
jgi:hypothetical protein